MNQISDREYNKINQILDKFSIDCTMRDYNDDFIYINNGKRLFKLDRIKISPDIPVEEAVSYIKFFE